MNQTRAFFSAQNIAAFILVLFCIQYIPLESREGVSYLKLTVSLLCPLVFITKTPWITKSVILFLLYYALVVFAAVCHPATLRWSTVLFLATFIMVYITYYNLVTVNRAFTRSFFSELLRKLIIAYFIVLVLQHCLLLVGVKIFPLLNLVQDLKRGVAGNSLSYEPSSAAIILSFAYLSLLRMYELDYGRRLTFGELWEKDKWVFLAFLYTMVGLVSGSAMVGLVIIAFYFISPKQYIVAIPILVILVILFFNVDYLPLNRARESFLAFLTLDNKQVMEADESAAARIVPIVNTLTKLDLTSFEGWFGHGVDYGLSKWIYSDRIMIGGIADYGFLSFLVLQTIVYTCMIKRFFSLETLLWIFLGLMTLANVPINWGAMMLFTTVRFFQMDKRYGCLDNHS